MIHENEVFFVFPESIFLLMGMFPLQAFWKQCKASLFFRKRIYCGGSRGSNLFNEYVMLPGVDLKDFIIAAGYIGLFAVIFAETGLFLGFFLPGDSLLFVAGLLASDGLLSLPLLLALVFVGAVLGNVFGYIFGRRVGPALFKKEDSILFKKSHALKAAEFFTLYGGKTIIFARFVPIVRTFAPILAGVGKMDFKEFFLFNVIGAFLWSFGLLIGGFFLGKAVPDVDRYILPIVVVIVIVSFLPGVFKYIQAKKQMDRNKISKTENIEHNLP